MLLTQGILSFEQLGSDIRIWKRCSKQKENDALFRKMKTFRNEFTYLTFINDRVYTNETWLLDILPFFSVLTHSSIKKNCFASCYQAFFLARPPNAQSLIADFPALYLVINAAKVWQALSIFGKKKSSIGKAFSFSESLFVFTKVIILFEKSLLQRLLPEKLPPKTFKLI